MGFSCFLCYSLCSFKCNAHFSSDHWISSIYITKMHRYMNTHMFVPEEQSVVFWMWLKRWTKINTALQSLCNSLKQRTFFSYVARKLQLLEAPEIFIFPIPSSLSCVLGVEKLILFILLVLYYQSRAPPLTLQFLSFIYISWNCSFGNCIFLEDLATYWASIVLLWGLLIPGPLFCTLCVNRCADGCFHLTSDWASYRTSLACVGSCSVRQLRMPALYCTWVKSQ